MARNTHSHGARRRVSRQLHALLAAISTLAFLPAGADEGLNPRGNIERAIQQIEAVTGETVTNPFKVEPGDDPKVHCIENRFCDGRIGELRIEAMGRQIEITPAPKTPPQVLFGSCVGLLAAFTDNGTQGEMKALVHAATERVLDGERVAFDLGAVAFKMKLTSEDLPTCTVARFVQR